jgi:hypothetical protein
MRVRNSFGVSAKRAMAYPFGGLSIGTFRIPVFMASLQGNGLDNPDYDVLKVRK